MRQASSPAVTLHTAVTLAVSADLFASEGARVAQQDVPEVALL